MYIDWYNSYRFAPVFMSLKKEENHDGGGKKTQPTSGKKPLQDPEEMAVVSDAENVQSIDVKKEST